MNILVLTHSYPEVNLRWRGIFVQEQVKALSIKHTVVVVYFKIDYSEKFHKTYNIFKRK